MVGIPDFGHVSDPGAIELHDIGIVGCNRLAGWRNRSAFAGLRAMKHRSSNNRAAILVDRKGFQFIVAIGDRAQQALHPVRIGGKAGHLRKRVGLAGEGSRGPGTLSRKCGCALH